MAFARSITGARPVTAQGVRAPQPGASLPAMNMNTIRRVFPNYSSTPVNGSSGDPKGQPAQTRMPVVNPIQPNSPGRPVLNPGTGPVMPFNPNGPRDTRPGTGGPIIQPFNPNGPRGGGPGQGPGGNPRPTKPGRPVIDPPDDGPVIPPFDPNGPRDFDPPDKTGGPDPTEMPEIPDDGKTGGPKPTEMPGDENFAKGQVLKQQMPNGAWQPHPGDFYSSEGFNAYRGANQGFGPVSRASGYDPYGIGQDAYGGGGYGGLPLSSRNMYGLTGVNSATGYSGSEKYGVVGGNGGYGFGMVNPEYSGPMFDDARGALRALRRQRRLLNQPTQAIPAGNTGGPGTGGNGGWTGGGNGGDTGWG